MDAPPVQYVRTSDGYNIAYTVSGQGDPLIVLPTAHSHAQLNWNSYLFAPSRPRVLQRLNQSFQVIQFDHRGQGMSTRGLPNDISMASFLRDLEAVIDFMHLNNFVLFGAGVGAHLAAHYAVHHPGSVRALVLMGPVAMGASFSGSFGQLASQNWEYFLESQLAIGLSVDDARRGIEMLQQITTQQDWEAAWRVWLASDISDLLPGISTPSLVMHARDFRLFRQEEAMALAALLPNARMTLVDGASMFGQADQTAKAIEDFLNSLGWRSALTAVSPEDRTVPRDAARLSKRQAQVLQLLAQGLTNREIADRLTLSERTVQRHISDVYDKLAVRNRTEATALVLRRSRA